MHLVLISNSIRIETLKGLLRHMPGLDVLEDTRQAVGLELCMYENILKQNEIYGVPAWTYANGHTLFETDKVHVHIHNAMSSYFDFFYKVRAMLDLCPGVLTGDNTAFLRNEVINPVHSAIRTQYFKRLEEAKAVLEERSVETSTFIQCRKCKSSDVDTEQKQTRSADEPMTLFCFCKACGSRFVMH